MNIYIPAVGTGAATRTGEDIMVAYYATSMYRSHIDSQIFIRSYINFDTYIYLLKGQELLHDLVKMLTVKMLTGLPITPSSACTGVSVSQTLPDIDIYRIPHIYIPAVVTGAATQTGENAERTTYRAISTYRMVSQ